MAEDNLWPVGTVMPCGAIYLGGEGPTPERIAELKARHAYIPTEELIHKGLYILVDEILTERHRRIAKREKQRLCRNKKNSKKREARKMSAVFGILIAFLIFKALGGCD